MAGHKVLETKKIAKEIETGNFKRRNSKAKMAGIGNVDHERNLVSKPHSKYGNKTLEGSLDSYLNVLILFKLSGNDIFTTYDLIRCLYKSAWI